MKKLHLTLLIVAAVLVTAIVTIYIILHPENKHAYSIPKDAVITMSIDPISMAWKSGVISEMDNIKTKMLQLDNDENFQKVAKKLFDDPRYCGIKLIQRIYYSCVCTNAEQLDFYHMVALGVNDKEKLLNCIEELGVGIEFKTINNCYVSTNGESTLIFNDERCLLIVGDNSESIALSLIDQKKENSIASTKAFEKLDNEDINLLATLTPSLINSAPKYYASQIEENLPKGLTLSDFENLSLLTTADFQDGKIVINSKIFTENEKLKEYINDIEIDEIDDKYLEYIPEDALGLFAFSTNGKKILEDLTSNKEIMDELENIEYFKTIKPLIQNLSGTVMLSFNDFVSFSAFAELEDEKTSKNVIAGIANILETDMNMPVNNRNECYSIKEDYSEICCNFGVEDETLFIAANNKLKNYKFKELDNSIDDADLVDDIDDCYSYLYINLDKALQNKELIDELDLNASELTILNSLLKDVKIKYEEVDEFTIEIGFDNDDDNVLEVIYDFVSDLM